jgi:hypothetical protein
MQLRGLGPFSNATEFLEMHSVSCAIDEFVYFRSFRKESWVPMVDQSHFYVDKTTTGSHFDLGHAGTTNGSAE